MAANYKLVRNPNPNAKEPEKTLPLHPRLVSSGTLYWDKFIERAKARSTFSPTDMKGIMQLFQDMMVDYLMAGYNIELGGIGTFSVSLQGRPEMEKSKIRSESIHFKTVRFRASKELKERLKAMPVFRDKEKASDPSYLPAEACEEELFHFLETNPYITSREYRTICGCSRSKAALDLRKYTQEGKLIRKRLGNLHLYYKATDGKGEPDSGINH